MTVVQELKKKLSVFDPQQRQRIFPLAYKAHPASYPGGTGSKMQLGHDADHSPPI
jgi:hypothetical protein